MATVFMRWLETKPSAYERGISLLTLGRIDRARQRIARDHVQEGTRVLEIGCGAGTLAVMLAKRGAVVTGIDASSAMLAQARFKVADAGLGDRVTLEQMDAALIGERYPPATFDLIVAVLVFSELTPEAQRYVLRDCGRLLASGGRLVLVDETIPTRRLAHIAYSLVRWPLVLLTWLLTRATTTALRDIESTLRRGGFQVERAATYLGGSLTLYELTPAEAAPGEGELPLSAVGTLQHRVSLRTLLLDLWALFFRIIPPYPNARPGLYVVGHPDADAPVLVTGNYDLTVRRLVRAIDGQVNVWVLVADSAGLNVWCGAGGGYFTADKVIDAVKSSRLEVVVSHRDLILPQLCAVGVDGRRIHREVGWRVRWGPVRANDIPVYLAAGCVKTDAMRRVRFPLMDRLEMTTVAMGFYGLLILLPVLIFWRPMFWPVTVSLLGLSYLNTVLLPWLPGRDGLYKSIPLAAIALTGLFVYALIWVPLPAPRLFRWALGLIGLSVFSASELQGMSPLMRGEQANWLWEAVIAAALGAVYWLVPLALGWR